MTNQQTTLQRFAAVIPVFVEAGCPEPTGFLKVAMFDDDMKPKTVGKIYREPTIALLKEWFREKVVVWAYKLCEIQPPEYDGDTWLWLVHSVEGSDPDPTEATIQCAEEAARVIGDKQ